MLEHVVFSLACVLLPLLPHAVSTERMGIRWIFDLVEAPAIDSPQVLLLARQERETDAQGNAEFTYSDPTDGRSYRLVFKNARLSPSGMVQFGLDWQEVGSGALRERFKPLAVDGSFWLALYRKEGRQDGAGKTVFIRCHPAPAR